MKLLYQFAILIFALGTLIACEKEDDPTKGTFTDSRDGNSYKWVQIGDQIWMAENLAFLPKADLPQNPSEVEPCYYVAGYDGTYITEEISETNHQVYRVAKVDEAKNVENYKKYGVLYNWNAAVSACPEGWHLPSDEEWEQLAQYVSNQKGPFDTNTYSWDEVGSYLKATNGWNDNGNGTDDFSFSALPGGIYHLGDFGVIGERGFWWSSSTEVESTYTVGFGVEILFDRSTLYKYSINIKYGESIRCVKD